MTVFHASLIPALLLSAVACPITSAAPSPGGTEQPATLVHSASLDATYEAVLNEVKNEGLSVDSASKDAGIKTATTVAGHYHQTGLHLEIQFIQENPNQTTVRVAALKQTREPWSLPKIDPKQSQDAADKLKGGLGW